MTKRPRRNHGAVFKAKVGTLEALKGEQTLVELLERFQVHANQITEWKKVLVERAVEVFDKGKPSQKPDMKELHVKIGQLAMENDSLAVALGRIPTSAREVSGMSSGTQTMGKTVHRDPQRSPYPD